MAKKKAEEPIPTPVDAALEIPGEFPDAPLMLPEAPPILDDLPEQDTVEMPVDDAEEEPLPPEDGDIPEIDLDGPVPSETDASVVPPDLDIPPAEPDPEQPADKRPRKKKEAAASTEEPPAPRRAAAPRAPGILTIENRAQLETERDREDTAWHEIHNAYRTRRILTGTLGGLEQTENGKTLVIVEYKGFRVVIPIKEMMLNLRRSPSGDTYAELMRRQNKVLSTMLGAEIDFIVRGIETKTRSIVASRKEAIVRKRQIFYLDNDATGNHRIHVGRLVQARVIAVADKLIRVEAFGVECTIMARDLAWDWMGDAHERFNVGDRVVVRILEVTGDTLENLSIRADVKSVSTNTDLDNLKKCRIQGKYAGKVTDVHKGVTFIRLTNGVNAVAHSCYDRRTPGKNDDISFAVTHLDMERGVAVGIITRIIKQNL